MDQDKAIVPVEHSEFAERNPFDSSMIWTSLWYKRISNWIEPDQQVWSIFCKNQI